MTHPTDEFRYATSRDTSIESFFYNSTDPTLSRMGSFMKKYNVKNIPEGISKLLKGYVTRQRSKAIPISAKCRKNFFMSFVFRSLS